MGVLVLPMMKSPWSAGRLGPTNWQDWMRSCVRAAKLAERWRSSEILVVSGFDRGDFDEVSWQTSALIRLGVSEGRVRQIRQGTETIGQLAAAVDFAKMNSATLIVISSWLHWPRIWWLTRHETCVSRRITFGIPRPKEAITDAILAVAFPLIDLCGGRRWFLEKTTGRRAAGQL